MTTDTTNTANSAHTPARTPRAGEADQAQPRTLATGTVEVTDHGAFLEVTINRPAKRNALDQATIDALAAAWDTLEEGPWEAAVLTGAGDRAFCAGADITDPPSNDDPAYPNFYRPMTKPVVAAVEGFAIGAGFVLSQSADIVVAGRGASFGYPEASIGVTGGGATFLTTRVPHKVVADLLLTARRYDAERAREAGLVSELVDSGEALGRARELARAIAANHRPSVRALKALVDADVQRSTIESAQRAGRLTADSRDRDGAFARLRERRGA